MRIFIILKKSIILSSLCLILFLCQSHLYVEKKLTSNENNDFIGYLVIPKISMNLGFYDVDDERNDVNKNIEVLSKSKEGSLFIAGHSGVGKVAYFNDLAKLKINDEIIVIYKKEEYKYIVQDIYKEVKDGNIRIKTETNEKFLVLTTCDQINKGYQLVIKAILK